ncbi:MAG: NADH-quinone oxidoreductase subunit NuoH [Cyanobacteria bacterium J06600_6]
MDNLLYIIESLLKTLFIIVPLLICVAYFTLVERKFMGAIQRRRGPNVIGYLGLLQPLSDGLKLFAKETIIPSSANTALFIFAPMLTFTLSLLGWVVIPFGEGLVVSDLSIGLLYLFAISSLGVYGIVIAGWSSNSKYSFLGALRSAAQMVSYEVSIGFIIITVVLCSGSFNLSEIIKAQENVWFCVPLFPMFVLFFISVLAETNRHPFDLPEAEAELVSGYNTEYTGFGFALFFLGEYSNMLLMSALSSILFLGGWHSPISALSLGGALDPLWFGLKICVFVLLFVLMRAALPRYRYDQLMALGWKIFLPFSLGWLMLTASLLLCFNILP